MSRRDGGDDASPAVPEESKNSTKGKERRYRKRGASIPPTQRPLRRRRTVERKPEKPRPAKALEIFTGLGSTIAAIAAGLGVMVSAGQLDVASGQLDAANSQLDVMRQTLRDSEDAANAAINEQVATDTRQERLVHNNEKLADSAKTQADAASGQLSLALNTERAWLKVTPRLSGPVTFDDDFGGVVYVPLNFSVENVGHLPAFNIQVRQWTVPYSKYIQKDLNDKCNALTGPVPAEKSYGRIIFPGVKIDDWNKTGDIGEEADYGFAYRSRMEKASGGLGKPIQIWVIGCVAYDLGQASKTRHHTGFVYRLGHIIQAPIPGGKALDVTFNWGEKVPVESILLDTGWTAAALID